MIALDDSIYCTATIAPPNKYMNWQTLQIVAEQNGRRAFAIQKFDPYYQITVDDQETLRLVAVKKLKGGD